MPVRSRHDPTNHFDVLVGYALVKQIAHGIHEHKLRGAPQKRLSQLLRNKSKIETVFIWMPLHSPETLGECLRIAVLATGADLRAATNWIPGGVGPFDFRVARQEVPQNQMLSAECCI